MHSSSTSPEKVTQLLTDWREGNATALTELTPLVYEDLRRLAQHYMSGQRPDHTLQATALVNEAYLRLADQTNPSWQNRAHFFAVAARAMRHILVDYARRYRSQKRGGGAVKLELDETVLVSPEQSMEIADLHEALENLSALDARKAEVVELNTLVDSTMLKSPKCSRFRRSRLDGTGISPGPGSTRNYMTRSK